MENNNLINKNFELTLENDQFNAIYNSELCIKKIKSFINKENHKVFGLYGKWGSGKTSLLNFMTRELHEYKIIKIDLWKYELLQNDLYNIINYIFINCVNKYTRHFKKVTKALFYTFVDLSNSQKIKFLRTFKKNFDKAYYKEILNNEFNVFLKKYFNEINKTSKKIIIIFDEIDRCSDSNIIKYINFIKNIVSELNSNIKIIISTDYDYLIHSINNTILTNDKKTLKSQLFLSKIIDDSYSIETFKTFKPNESDSELKWGTYVNKMMVAFHLDINQENEFLFNPRFNMKLKSTNTLILNSILNEEKSLTDFKNEIEFIIFYFQMLEHHCNKKFHHFIIDRRKIDLHFDLDIEFNQIENDWAPIIDIEDFNDKNNNKSFKIRQQLLKYVENNKNKINYTFLYQSSIIEKNNILPIFIQYILNSNYIFNSDEPENFKLTYNMNFQERTHLFLNDDNFKEGINLFYQINDEKFLSCNFTSYFFILINDENFYEKINKLTEDNVELILNQISINL